MGEVLVRYFDYVQKEAGMPAKMRLAMKVNMTSQKAAGEPDSEENLARVRAAVKEILDREPPVL